jgi:hypothetical protein
MRGQAYRFNLHVSLTQKEHNLNIYIYENGEVLLDTDSSSGTVTDPQVLLWIESLSHHIQAIIRDDIHLETDPRPGQYSLSKSSEPFDHYLFAWSKPCPSWVLETIARSFTLTLMVSGLLIEEVRQSSTGQTSALVAGLLAAILPYSWSKLRMAATSISLMSTVFGASSTFLMTLMSLTAQAMNLTAAFDSQLSILKWITKGIAIFLGLASFFQPSSKLLMAAFLADSTRFAAISRTALQAQSFAKLQKALKALKETRFATSGVRILGKKAPETSNDSLPITVMPPKLSTAIMRILSQPASMAAKASLFGFAPEVIMAIMAAASFFSLLHYLVDARIDLFGKSIPPVSERAPKLAWVVKGASEATELLLAGGSAALNMSMICATVLTLCQTSIESSLATGIPSAAVSISFGLGVMFMVAYLRGHYGINPFGSGTQGAIADATHQTEQTAMRGFLIKAAKQSLDTLQAHRL